MSGHGGHGGSTPFLTLRAVVVLLFIASMIVAARTPRHYSFMAPIATFGDVSLRIEYATSSEALSRGLSGRSSIDPDYGMLFIFPDDGFHGFWMKGMLIPIDIFWLDSQGQVVYQQESVKPSTYPHVFYPSVPARFVLETHAGFAVSHRVSTGTVLDLKNLDYVSQ